MCIFYVYCKGSDPKKLSFGDNWVVAQSDFEHLQDVLRAGARMRPDRIVIDWGSFKRAGLKDEQAAI